MQQFWIHHDISNHRCIYWWILVCSTELKTMQKPTVGRLIKYVNSSWWEMSNVVSPNYRKVLNTYLSLTISSFIVPEALLSATFVKSFLLSNLKLVCFCFFHLYHCFRPGWQSLPAFLNSTHCIRDLFHSIALKTANLGRVLSSQSNSFSLGFHPAIAVPSFGAQRSHYI